ncbi:MAG: LptF/LptG family permease [Bacteroidota bacterium]
MKKIDKLVFTSFVGPFLVAFLIAVFVLLMQTLWLYLDDIAGKGLGFLLIMELLGYKIVGLFPLAMPIAVLIASVMVMGNMAERYELSSFKSAGISLIRVMRAIIGVGALAAVASFLFSDYVIPRANLKFGSRMYDISQQKPTLRLDAGVFNYDFKGFAIHIGDKEENGQGIDDVLIYDHSTTANKGDFTQMIANNGEMYVTGDGQYFVMDLNDGYQNIETNPSVSVGANRDYPFVRIKFSRWIKAFDLGEFELNRTDEQMFRHNRSMMTVGQMQSAIDSISIKIDKRERSFSNYLTGYFNFLDMDSTYLEFNKEDATEVEIEQKEAEEKYSDTTSVKRVLTARKIARGGRMIEQSVDSMYAQTSFVKGFETKEQRRLLNKAVAFAKSIKNRAAADNYFLGDVKENKVKFMYDMHTKFSMAMVCLIFVFIGAPMGAIVRKGGFGYPILISIIFFMVYVVMLIFFKKIAESFVVPADVAAWLSCLVMIPVGALLSYQAMYDVKIINFEPIKNFFQRIFRKKESKTKA